MPHNLTAVKPLITCPSAGQLLGTTGCHRRRHLCWQTRHNCCRAVANVAVSIAELGAIPLVLCSLFPPVATSGCDPSCTASLGFGASAVIADSSPVGATYCFFWFVRHWGLATSIVRVRLAVVVADVLSFVGIVHHHGLDLALTATRLARSRRLTRSHRC
ncbi:unnamed protein product [Phytophthora fragariaefolia]|uniref:Unnamed protein product n=1 Tax=Phytophthora fragariaefolia TaxID=1490495 RepID=A0A9W7D7S3_9STRA|nr:unnamed protein product [Phytophthora fragariaefolia]